MLEGDRTTVEALNERVKENLRVTLFFTLTRYSSTRMSQRLLIYATPRGHPERLKYGTKIGSELKEKKQGMNVSISLSSLIVPLSVYVSQLPCHLSWRDGLPHCSVISIPPVS